MEGTKASLNKKIRGDVYQKNVNLALVTATIMQSLTL